VTRIEDYQILISPLPEEDGGGFFASIPDLPGCHSDGKTPHEALTNVYDALPEWVDSRTDGAPDSRPTSKSG
jgi:predicted RNase H-like HicB family nuclease